MKNQEFTKILVDTFYMEMLEKPNISINLPKNVYFEQQNEINVEEYLTVYKNVGEKWGWSGRLILSEEKLAKILNDPDNIVYFMYYENEICGFFELYKHSKDDIELIYMGLTPEFIGKGLGKKLLKYAIKTAWESDIKRLWLHTCEFDHSNALEVYKKSGFSTFKQQTDEEYYPVKFLENIGMI